MLQTEREGVMSIVTYYAAKGISPSAINGRNSFWALRPCALRKVLKGLKDLTARLNSAGLFVPLCGMLQSLRIRNLALHG